MTAGDEADQSHLERSLLILYATETGNSLDAAERIARESRRRHFHTRIASVDAYPLSELISEHLVIFVLSTTGSGIEPRTMTPLWQMLVRSDLPSDLFEGLDYAVFGLGDSAYEKFCWASKKLARRLQSLGGHEIWKRGDADEQERFGVEGALEGWMEGLFEALLQLYPLPPGKEILPADVLPPPRASITMLPQKSSPQSPPLSPRLSSTSQTLATYYDAKLKSNERITATGWYQDVRHIEFEFSNDIQYEPGDIAVLHPEATPSDVDNLLERLGWTKEADQEFTVTPLADDQPLPPDIPTRLTLRTAFSHYLDINAVPRRSFFELLRYFTEDPTEKEKLQEFCTKEGQDELYEYIARVRRTIQEVIMEFRYVVIPKEYIFDLFPPLRPRQFSIASSVRRHPKEIHLCVAIVKYKTKLKAPRKGVCTTWLADLTPGSQVRVGIQTGTMHLPPSHETPVVCVGPGTGVAPMRSMIEERMHYGATDNTLYFGCRSSTQDFHYSHEWEDYSQHSQLVFRVAYSRDQATKVYVQDIIREDSLRIWELVGVKGAWVYISGSSNKMPLGVKLAIEHAARVEGGKTEEEAKEFMLELEREGRLIEECWS